ncbi:MAG: hypothetical protein EPO58_09960 [Chitinophagaceae bacterium]|nr:MAG: hypothetical protein EPO58_09960 [Chitinophagaceae bacterium]
MEDAAEKIERQRTEYNQYQPHSSLDDMTPVEYVGRCLKLIEETVSLPKAFVLNRMILQLKISISCIRKIILPRQIHKFLNYLITIV